MGLWSWLRDHRVQSLVAVVALLVGILALLRDVIGFQLIDPGREAATIATPVAAGAVRRGPQELRMVGGKADVLETEVDLDSAALNWGVNSCAAGCDLNFRGSENGIEEAYGQMSQSPADRESCRSATTYGYTLVPRDVKEGAEVCVLTDEGRSAGLVVKQVRTDRGRMEIIFEATVWEK